MYFSPAFSTEYVQVQKAKCWVSSELGFSKSVIIVIVIDHGIQKLAKEGSEGMRWVRDSERLMGSKQYKKSIMFL